MVAYSNLKGTRSPPARILPPSSPAVLAPRRPASDSGVLREGKQGAPTTGLAGCKSSKARCPPPVPPLGAPSAAGAMGAPRFSFFPPRRPERLGPAAVELLEPVRDRVLLVEVLVVLLGGIELGGRHDLGDDQPLDRLGLHQRFLRSLGKPLLRLVVVEDGRAVLESIVTELPVRRGWINVVPEDLQELGVADLGGIEEDLDRLRVAGLPGRHVLVGRILLHAAGIAGRGGNHAVHLVQRLFHAPETPARERGLLQSPAVGAWRAVCCRGHRAGQQDGDKEQSDRDALVHGLCLVRSFPIVYPKPAGITYPDGRGSCRERDSF